MESRGRVVMNGAENRPLLLLDRKDRGRVALLLSDHAWLWARGYEGGGPHTDLLRRLAHWLMKEPDLEEERLLASARGLKLTIERRSMEESVPAVQLSAPGGETSEVTLDRAGPGLWRSTVDVKAPGLYKMQSASPSGRLTAVAHRAGRLGLARPQGSRSLRHPRRQADPDVQRPAGTGSAAGPARRHLVARGALRQC
jgi:hypothetical protein